MNYSDRSREDSWKKLWNMKKQWPSLKTDNKNFYFGEYFSHEVHFFIKKYDSKYFEEVARSFLSSKMEKSFIDMYLLDMDKQIC